MRVGLFGGSFNPPHLAHLIVAETIREQFALDQILWMPAYHPPHKDPSHLAAAEHRLAMVQLATAQHAHFAVSDLEIQREGTSYTFHTVCTLQEQHPETTFFLLLGGDSLHGFPTWYQPDGILERVPLLVYHRPGSAPTIPEGLPTNRIHTTNAPQLDLASAYIRDRLHKHQSIRYLVPETVRAYIKKHRLYSVTVA